jgi:membrane-bound ClpP family serine protease
LLNLPGERLINRSADFQGALEEEPMPPRGVKSSKRKRQYSKVLKSIKRQGRYRGRQKEVAARIVNKTRRRKGETKRRSRRRAA